MTTARSVLGQVVSSAANTDTTLYTVPAATDAVCSALAVCNTDTSSHVYTIKIRIAGASSTTKQVVASAVPIGASTTQMVLHGLTLATTDVVTVQSDSVLVTFNLFGQQNS